MKGKPRKKFVKMKENNDKIQTDSGQRTSKILTIPNILSFFRICLIPVIVWLYVVKKESVAAGGVLILSGATDIVDGFIARRFNMISDIGKVLDPVADKLTQATMLVCLVVRYPLMLVPFLLMVVKEIYMLVAGYFVIKRTGVVMGANWHGKLATCFLYAMMLLHVFWPKIPKMVSDVTILACGGTIVLSFVLYGLRNRDALRQERE